MVHPEIVTLCQTHKKSTTTLVFPTATSTTSTLDQTSEFEQLRHSDPSVSRALLCPPAEYLVDADGRTRPARQARLHDAHLQAPSCLGTDRLRGPFPARFLSRDPSARADPRSPLLASAMSPQQPRRRRSCFSSPPARSRSRASPQSRWRGARWFVNAEVWVRRVRVLRFLKGGTDRQRRRDCCFDRSTGRPLAGSVQAPAVGGLSLARESTSEPCDALDMKAQADAACGAVDRWQQAAAEAGVSSWGVATAQGGSVASWPYRHVDVLARERTDRC
jgi:hypothetical protein